MVAPEKWKGLPWSPEEAVPTLRAERYVRTWFEGLATLSGLALAPGAGGRSAVQQQGRVRVRNHESIAVDRHPDVGPRYFKICQKSTIACFPKQNIQSNRIRLHIDSPCPEKEFVQARYADTTAYHTGVDHIGIDVTNVTFIWGSSAKPAAHRCASRCCSRTQSCRRALMSGSSPIQTHSLTSPFWCALARKLPSALKSMYSELSPAHT